MYSAKPKLFYKTGMGKDCLLIIMVNLRSKNLCSGQEAEDDTTTPELQSTTNSKQAVRSSVAQKIFPVNIF